MQVSGSVVLVTGATGGLGQALAERFAAAGGRLVVSGRRPDELEELAERVGGRAVVADLAVPGATAELASAAGPVDILVANAAQPSRGGVLDYDEASMDAAIDVNLRSPMQLARALLPAMLERRKGHVVLISSLNGVAASPGSSVYAATKFGLRGFGHGLRQDLAGTGVGVSVVLPGFISEAGMFARSGAKLPPGVGMVTPTRVADAVVDAVRRNRTEVSVAPTVLKLGAHVGGLFPAASARVQDLAGARQVAGDVAGGHRQR